MPSLPHTSAVRLVGLALVLSALACRPPAPPPPAPEGPDTRLQSPDGQISLRLEQSQGQLLYAVDYQGRTIVKPSRLGFQLADGTSLPSGGLALKTRLRGHDSLWQPPWGTDAQVRDHYNELVVELREQEAPGRELVLILRAYDDGIAFRFDIPSQPGLERLSLKSEDTEFNLAGDPLAWWTPVDFDSDEYLYRKTPLSGMGGANLPVTFKFAEDVYVSIHEADLVDYAAMTLAPTQDHSGLRALLVPTPGRSTVVEAALPHATPWRTLQIASRPGALMESHLLENLNPPCRICDGDTSWIKPIKYVGIWWEMQRTKSTWNEGPEHGATTANAKRYIDFAAAHGIQALLAEGWNAGWEGSWADQDFTRAASDFDLAEVVRYGQERGVGFIAHNETGAGIANYEQQIDRAFALYEQLGIHAIKTGYVGAIEGHHHYDQAMVNHYRMVVEKAAAHHIMVDCHECIHAAGEMRTWPNVMSREAMRGQEYDAFSEGNPPEHTLILPFTRGLAGPLDYTPGIFDITWDPKGDGRRVHSTVARQLALYVHLFSGVQMAADLPENYANRPELKFIEDVPVSWDETRVLSASIGEHLVVARRKGAEWFIGSGTDSQARTLDIPLSFLGAGKYVAETYTDAAETELDLAPTPVARSTFLVSATSTLVAAMAPGGGQAVRLRPALPAEQSSLADFQPPRLAVSQLQAPSRVFADDLLTLTATVSNPGSLVAGGTLTLLVDGTPTVAKALRVNAGQSRSVALQLRLSATGSHTLTLGDAPAVTVDVRPASEAPVAPANLRVTASAGQYIQLAWEPVPYAASAYHVYRRFSSSDTYEATPLATLAGTQLTFTDTQVQLQQTYSYLVRAITGQGTASIASNEVSRKAEPALRDVTFRVLVPASTPAGATVYLVGSADVLGPWNPGRHPMTDKGGGLWETTIPLSEGIRLQYKYTRGSWESVEWWGPIVGTNNRTVRIEYVTPTPAAQLVDDTSSASTTPDEHKAIVSWRDPLVVSTQPSNGAHVSAPASITLTFERDVKPAGATFGDEVIVKKAGERLSGSVDKSATGTLRWTPGAPLSAGDYEVTVSGVMSLLGDDSVSMRAPYTFMFTVQ